MIKIDRYGLDAYDQLVKRDNGYLVMYRASKLRDELKKNGGIAT